jgi:hypothetical protein
MRQGTASRRHGMRSKGGATAHPDCWNDPLADEISRRSPRPVHWRQFAKPRPIGLEELTFFRASSVYGVRAAPRNSKVSKRKAFPRQQNMPAAG